MTSSSNAPNPPTIAQVISAAIQNVLVIGALCAAWYLDKIDAVVAIPALLFVVGVDFLGRKRLPGSSALLIGLGATGVLDVLMNLPYLGAVLVGLTRFR